MAKRPKSPQSDRRSPKNAPKARERAPVVVREAEPEIREQQIERFCQAMATHGVLHRAAAAAGYTGSTTTLARAGRALYDTPAVRARIDEINADILRELRITTTAIKAGLARVAFADPALLEDEAGNLLPLSKVPVDTRLAIQGIKRKRATFGEGGESEETEYRMADRTRALQLLGQDAGMWKEQGAADVVAEMMKAWAAAKARVAAPYQPETLAIAGGEAQEAADLDRAMIDVTPAPVDAKPASPSKKDRHTALHLAMARGGDHG